ncbi:hypothetical protein C9J01_03865 [Photobacterium rosenbergii]|uniref:DUF6351 domain-containing protein n=1 Tax=Photobacterium rosenbergii TaxID=294936 RepID=A0A2T3NKZ3_9GAMM|nr:DUF6351 family protein [Photobacterium rosenbergii]PSW16150.1 hypothetical protein C9J01_03865 [Photobacterium rosenbergii]
MKKLIIGLVVLFAVVITALQFDNQNEIVERQVKGLAPEQPNYLLEVEGHISHSPRPEETYEFPIRVGEIGPVNSLYSGPNQYPFFCMTLDSGLGQPVVDNQDGYGVPIYETFNGKKLIGYSKDCAIKTQLSYVVVDQDNLVTPRSELELKDNRPGDDELLIRIEKGTINRYIYTIAMPIEIDELGSQDSAKAWNKRLIYRFEGGSGLGFRQGKMKLHRLIKKELSQIRKGYAVVASSGNKTSYGYNMLLAEDTARRVKKQFVSLFGEPLYTIGIGGSGGGLAQYLIAQNSEGILDGLLPLYSYPDMVSVSIYALDCDLLNTYFSFRAGDRERWQDWQSRQYIEGLRAINEAEQRFGWLQPLNQLVRFKMPEFPQGNSECINGYFGLSSYLNNPRQGFLKPYYHESVVEEVNWNYWQDLVHVYGKDEHGFAQSTWDNEGVQYGLKALREKMITLDEFIEINQKIGAWKPFNDMESEKKLSLSASIPPLWLSLWGEHNVTEDKRKPAKRRSAPLSAIERAYTYGQVFIGNVSLPIIDIRHHLEDDLNMHHTSASFSTRLRILEAMNHADNHVIWISHKQFNPVEQAYSLMDEWLMAMRSMPATMSYEQKVKVTKPQLAVDTCFDGEGNIHASGLGVFDGQWNGKANGQCTQVYPIYSNSRIQAGAPWKGSIFKCHRVAVEEAIEKGFYGDVDVSGSVDLLKKTFPDGVCDYSLGDKGRPSNIMLMNKSRSLN